MASWWAGWWNLHQPFTVATLNLHPLRLCNWLRVLTLISQNTFFKIPQVVVAIVAGFVGVAIAVAVAAVAAGEARHRTASCC